MAGEVKQCPLCKVEGAKISNHGENFGVQCERCGRYLITWEFIHYSAADEMEGIGHRLSGLSRELHEGKENPPMFRYDEIKKYLEDSRVPDTDDVEAKATKLLQYLKVKSQHYGDTIELLYSKDYPLAYAKNPEEFFALIKLLEDSGHIDILGKTNAGIQLSLSAKGWDIAKNLKKANVESDQGFIAIWFDESMNESATAIKEAIEQAGFKAMYIRAEHFSERIMDKALTEIRQSRFLVVDLTGNRPSVFFEAGFAHGLGIETLYVYKEGIGGENFPLEFYARHYQCYRYKDSNELTEILTNAISARLSPRKT